MSYVQQSVTSLCNLSLQMLSQDPIADITDNTRNGRECFRVYDIARRAELRAHLWRFSLKRVSLAPLGSAPTFGFNFQFPMPADCLRPLKPDVPGLPGVNDPSCDWEVEGRNILTNNNGTELDLRYVADIEDVALFDPNYFEAMGAKMAKAMCYKLTNSNSKEAQCQKDYDRALAEARRINAYIQVPRDGDEGSWLLSRLGGSGSWF